MSALRWLLAASFGGSGGGQSLSRLGLCGFSFCLQPDVCFVLKGRVLLTADARATSLAVRSAVPGSSAPAAGGRGIPSLALLSLSATMQNHLVNQAFIRHLLVVVGCGRWWAKPHPFRRALFGAVCSAHLKGNREGDGGEKGRQTSARVGVSAFHFPRRASLALHPHMCQGMLTALLVGFQPAITKWTTLYTFINMLSPSH